jgi:methionyl-tRNA formyltransferase
MQPWPGTFTILRGKLLKVLEAEPATGQAPPGVVVGEGAGAAVGTGDGLLRLGRVQIEGKKPLDIEEFLRGRPDFVSSTLG